MPITKLTPESAYPYTQERLKALEQAVPEAFADGKINWNTLREVLGEDLEDESRGEFFGLTWPGKREARKKAAIPSRGTLVPAPGEGVNEDTTENIFIEGDNLEVLKLLQKSYAGKIKMIYIDPPYNTGNDFIYNDDFADPLEAYLAYTGAKGEGGELLTTNTRADGRFHTRWLNMMYPRLILARQLLREDGAIFISIDDNEVHHLRQIMNEIFGDENFVACISVKMSESTGVKMAHVERRLPKLKEYLLFYKRPNLSIKPISIPKDVWDNEYKVFLCNLSQNDSERIKEIRDNEDRTEADVIEVDTILSKVGFKPVGDCYKENSITDEQKKLEFNYTNAWRIVRTVSVNGGAKSIADNKRQKCKAPLFSIETPDKKMYFIKNEYSTDKENPRIKVIFADDYLTFNPGDFWQDIKTTGLGDEGEVDFRNGKKPIRLIKRALELTTNNQDIVLDFFAGSASTAHAIFENNIELDCSRKFILVQIEEKIVNNEFVNVAELGKARVRRVINKLLLNLPNESTELPLISKPQHRYDLGFRVFKYMTSCFKQWKPSDEVNPENLSPLFENLNDSFMKGWKKEDLLIEILLLEGFPLTSKIVFLEDLNQNQVYKVRAPNFCAHNLFVCLDETVKPETIDILTMDKEDIFVCLDSALNDELKARVADKFNAHVI